MNTSDETSIPRDRSRETLRACERLKKTSEFKRVYGARRSFADRWMIVYTRPNRLGHPRLGLSVGRRFGNAVQRNRLKRLYREAFRRRKHRLPPFDLIMMPRGREMPDYEQVVRSLERLAEQARRAWHGRVPEGPDHARGKGC